MGIVWPLLIYWFVLFVACYTIVEFGQDQLYDEVTPYAWAKVGGGSLLLAAMLTWLRSSFDTMFTTDLPWTVLQAMAWWLVFMFIFQFHPQHALVISTVAVLLLPGVATMGVESLTQPTPALTPARSLTSKPLRRGLTQPGAPAAKGAPVAPAGNAR
jgi:hypothetical protein